MTRLGYGEEMRRWRVAKYRELDRMYNKILCDVCTLFTAGSKAEGLTRFLESDIDIMTVANSALCVEAGINLHTIQDDIALFRMDTRVYPGHCKLFLERQGSRRCIEFEKAFCDNGYGDVLLSSSLYLDEISTIWSLFPQFREGMVDAERAGPSLPHTSGGVVHMDKVRALRCSCPSILDRWASRPRHWPSPVIVQKVVSLGAYVTPVGFKGSEFKHMEWRICFNTGETELVNNLNDTQAKVYVILKMILKDKLKPNNKEITSYVLKNIVLWQAERNPQLQFHARSLCHWLHDGLRELSTAIVKKHLPYYMIPERNLLEACGMNDVLQRKWVAGITDMLEDFPRVVLRLPKIRKAIVGSPEPMLWFSSGRMELEMLNLEWFIRKQECLFKTRDINYSDFTVQAIERRIAQIITEMQLHMLLDGSSIIQRSDIFKRMLM
ncbi:hypothetical protein DPMN_040244 [Dreissena polymorpha]|uniref:Mab-21-like nucleotidyltransferase domain-containing protein n=2 Tax=Dreissena polymorpha TaxID=45954 RepID=A0A9D4HV10_DREPO|nr:hypothetical protein DPMN_040244 [Dreissena polymorpha]